MTKPGFLVSIMISPRLGSKLISVTSASAGMSSRAIFSASTSGIRTDGSGRRVNDLKKAEIVLLGVSRTFKTPLSIYLAFKGWFVANVPIVMGQEFPAIINKLLASNVFCLDTNARALAELRHARQNYLGGAVGDYDDIEYIRMELMYARNIFSKNPGWAIINVTNKPIEEIASEILTLKGERGKGDKFPG